MTLVEAVENYLKLKRSMGAVFASDARILRSLGRAIGNVPLDSIGREACQVFCRGTGDPARFWERKYYTLRGFFSYLIARSYLATSPLPVAGPRIPRLFDGYVYSHDELCQLLNGTSMLDTARSRVRSITFRTLILVLYGAGLRPSEALRLRCCDVDLTGRILAIGDTKFFKSRFVPIGVELANALGTYWAARKRCLLPNDSLSTFFSTKAGHRISLATLEKAFVRLREPAGIHRPEARSQPRLHDLRRTFAVHRVISWYREGAEVQACLPLLATYLGHINLSGTQTYLTMTPELLGEASRRLDRYASIGMESNHA